jgi:ABC-type phosphate transport system substrate-binding protein
MNRRTLFILIAACLSAFAAGADEPQGFRVIVHPGNTVTSLSRDEVSRILLRKQINWSGGGAVDPVDQRGAEVRERFTQWAHRRSVQAISYYWQQQVFSGRGSPPAEKASDAEVIEYVARNPLAIGYVSPGARLIGVKPIQLSE